ncbi:MAG: DNA cytosine methyltransferase [Candidatus Nanopelagicaceae bacterium]
MLRAGEKTIRKLKPTVLDIFCGAGGMSLGFKNAGCEILGGIDQNRYAMDTHHRNFPKARLKLPSQDIRCIEDLGQLGLERRDVDISSSA